MTILFVVACTLAATDVTEMRIRVVDENKKPIAGAEVHVSRWSEKKFPTDYKTDADGVAGVKRPKERNLMRMWVSASGCAGLFRGWEMGEHEDGRLIPAMFEFPMRKATTAGGRIVDSNGRGVAGARVEVSLGKYA